MNKINLNINQTNNTGVLPYQPTKNPQYGDLVFEDSYGNHVFVKPKERINDIMTLQGFEYTGKVMLPKDENNDVTVLCPEKIGKDSEFEQDIYYTGEELDIALEGGSRVFPFFFQLENPSTGEIYYTQDGHFHLSKDGIIVNKYGHILLPEFIPWNPMEYDTRPEGLIIHITQNGNIGSFLNGEKIVSSSIPVFEIINPSTLIELPNCPGVYRMTTEGDLIPFENLSQEEQLRWCVLGEYIDTGEIVEDYDRRYYTLVTAPEIEYIPTEDNSPRLLQGYLNGNLELSKYKSYGFHIRTEENLGEKIELIISGFSGISDSNFFTINANGEIVDKNGFILEYSIILPENSEDLFIHYIQNDTYIVTTTDSEYVDVHSSGLCPRINYLNGLYDIYSYSLSGIFKKPYPKYISEEYIKNIKLNEIEYNIFIENISSYDIQDATYIKSSLNNFPKPMYNGPILGEYVISEEKTIKIKIN